MLLPCWTNAAARSQQRSASTPHQTNPTAGCAAVVSLYLWISERLMHSRMRQDMASSGSERTPATMTTKCSCHWQDTVCCSCGSLCVIEAEPEDSFLLSLSLSVQIVLCCVRGSHTCQWCQDSERSLSYRRCSRRLLIGAGDGVQEEFARCAKQG